MAERTALLVDEVSPEQPVRRCVLSYPFQLRFLLASRPEIMGRVPGIAHRMIATPTSKPVVIRKIRRWTRNSRVVSG